VTTGALSTMGQVRTSLDYAFVEVLELLVAQEIVIVDENRKGRSGIDRSAIPVVVHDSRTYGDLIRAGSVGFGRSYAAGWWDTDDLVGLCRVITRHLPRAQSPLGRSLRAVSAIRGDRSRGGIVDKAVDRLDIEAHYDLGDQFFQLFLDPTLTYSCAVFDRTGMTLEEAQLNKLDRICRKLELRPSDSLLEIGSGWGSLAILAASRYGCRVTTTTVSKNQFDYVTERVHDLGLDQLVTVLYEDYRDLTGTYDKLASVEMIEAVGWRQLDSFFRCCSERLVPGGLMVLQAIVIDDQYYERAKRSDDFIKAMIFPGSSIPSVRAIRDATGLASALRVTETVDIGAYYATTLASWRTRFNANREVLATLGYSEPFLRLWDLYLAYCEAGFAERRISDVQMRLVNSKRGYQR
jgi:cyclopropane-fatty-acyl-phospholipid synthase